MEESDMGEDLSAPAIGLVCAEAEPLRRASRQKQKRARAGIGITLRFDRMKETARFNTIATDVNANARQASSKRVLTDCDVPFKTLGCLTCSIFTTALA
jgi:hypothetical protein